MAEIVLRGKIEWKEYHTGWYWGCIGEHTLFRLLFDDGEWELSSGNIAFPDEHYLELDEAKQRAEILLLEFANQVFTIKE